MKCPYCAKVNNKVVDSRLSRDAKTIRRRRECLECGRRFTTYEKLEDTALMVVKKDGRREAFDRKKIISGIQKACQKRPVSTSSIEDFVSFIENHFQEAGKKEIESSQIGEIIIDKLKEWDDVAYVRFASVYRQFKDIREFMSELESILEAKKEMRVS